MNLAQRILVETDLSIVVVKDGKILAKKKGEGISPILKVMEGLKDKTHDTIIGDRILGKASSLLCAYFQVKGVYSPQATKTAIAILITAGIPVQTDKVIPYIRNREKDDICPFEKMLEYTNSPEKAYKILKEKVLE